MQTSEVLNKAADLIEERGWVRGPSGWISGGTGRLCLEGAILGALRVDAVADRTPLWTCPAYTAVSTYLGRDVSPREADPNLPTEMLWDWNDNVAKSAPHVVEVLRAAALIEAAHENAEAREAVTTS